MTVMLIACSAGYYGKNCNDKCPFPHFGLKCLLSCDCAVRNCNHVDGCNQLPGDRHVCIFIVLKGFCSCCFIVCQSFYMYLSI